MTVSELIDQLKKLPPDVRVVRYCDEFWCHRDVIAVAATTREGDELVVELAFYGDLYTSPEIDAGHPGRPTPSAPTHTRR